METFLLSGLQLQRGTVIDAALRVVVQPEDGPADLVACDVLRTSAAPPPPYAPGDTVVYVADSVPGAGYVLGLVSGMRLPDLTPAVEASLDAPPLDEATDLSKASTREGTLLEEIAPTASADGRVLSLGADERVEIRCGESALILRSDGHVVLKGRQVLTRARGVNKIKGAAVQIN